jgi:hypothetical protein
MLKTRPITIAAAFYRISVRFWHFEVQKNENKNVKIFKGNLLSFENAKKWKHKRKDIQRELT